MNFLLPKVLWFLLFAFIPFIIHLLSRYKSKNIDFSSIQYIKELKSSAIKVVKLKQLLTLIIRTLIIIVLVLLFSRPVTNSFLSDYGDASHDNNLKLIFDNSASMNVTNNQYSLLDSSKISGINLLKYFSKETQLEIIQTCPPRVLYSGTNKTSLVNNIIQSIEKTSQFDNIWKMLDSTTSKYNNNGFINECIVYSDFNTKSNKGFNLNKNWKYYFFQLGSPIVNAEIESATLDNKIKIPNNLLKVNTIIKNNSKSYIPNLPIELIFNGDRVGQVISNFEPNMKKEFQFQAFPNSNSIIKASVKIPDDDYVYDNIIHLTSPILKNIRCLTIIKNQSEKQIFQQIIKAIDPDSSFIESNYLYEFPKTPYYGNYDVLIIHNKIINNEQLEYIEVFLKNGGGVIWFNGDNNNYINNEFSNFPVFEKIIDSKKGFFSIKTEDQLIDILNDVNVKSIDKEMPRIFKYNKIKKNLEHKYHLVLNNNDPFLFETNVGIGTSFYFTSLIDMNWNDLPLRGIMIPIIHKILILSGSDEINTSSIRIGEEKSIRLNSDFIQKEWTLEKPSGTKKLIIPDYYKENLLINDNNELGFYNIYVDNKRYTTYATYLDDNEKLVSNVSNNYPNDLDKNNYRIVQLKNNNGKNFINIREGHSLWQVFLFILLILITIETFLTRPSFRSFKNNLPE